MREARLEQKKRVYAQTVHRQETEEATVSRLDRKKEHARVVSTAESPEARATRLEQKREHAQTVHMKSWQRQGQVD